MRISRDVALCCALLILVPMPGFSADLPTGAAGGGVAPEICFPVGDGERILRDLESLPLCRDAVTACEDALRSEEGRSQALGGRVIEQDRELTDAQKLVDDTRKAGEEAAKIASGPWYAKVLAAGKWIAAGLVIGFAAGISK